MRTAALLVLLLVSPLWRYRALWAVRSTTSESAVARQNALWMRAIFGNYDPKTKSSQTVVPSRQMNLKGTGFHAGDSLNVRVIWSDTRVVNGRPEVVVVTAGVPDTSSWRPIVKGDRPFSCHACAPLIGIHKLEKNDSGWVVVTSDVAVTTAGGWGEPPEDIRLIRIGPEEIAVEIRSTWEGGGITATGVQFLAEWRSSWREVFTSRLAEEDRGTCGDRADLGDLPCYAYRKRIRFAGQPGSSSYYDMLISQSGTYLDKNAKVHRVSGAQRFAFEAGDYVKVSEAGSTVPKSE